MLVCIHLPFFGGAQQTIPVADQTFRMDGLHTFVYYYTFTKDVLYDLPSSARKLIM